MIEQGAIEAFKERKSRKPKVNYNDYQALKAEKEHLEATVLEQAAELSLFKKRSLGLEGDLRIGHLSPETKEALVKLIAEVKERYSVTIEYCC